MSPSARAAACRRRCAGAAVCAKSAASRPPPGGGVGIEVHLNRDAYGDRDKTAEWAYRLVFNVERSGNHRIMVQEETVLHHGKTVMQRPDQDDKDDPELLTATALEQINANRQFRPVADFFDQVAYQHLVPQLVRYGAEIGGNRLENDPFGQGFLEKIAATDNETRLNRLDQIAASLSFIVPQLEDIAFERDEITGRPHLKARFGHWRGDDVWQRESMFSDGVLRLIGVLWALLDRPNQGGALLLEEPEISLHRDITLNFAGLIYRLSLPDWRDRYIATGKPLDNLKEQRQVILTTHSPDLLCDQGIDGWEVICVADGDNGSVVKPLAAHRGTHKLLKAGVVASVIAPFRNHGLMIPADMGFPF